MSGSAPDYPWVVCDAFTQTVCPSKHGAIFTLSTAGELVFGHDATD